MMAAVIVPGMLVTFLGLNYWFLPLDADQRQSFLVTILLTDVMFLTMLTTFVPIAR